MDPRPAVSAPDVLMPQVSGMFPGDAAAHTQLVGPKGQLSEGPPLLSWGSGPGRLLWVNAGRWQDDPGEPWTP